MDASNNLADKLWQLRTTKDIYELKIAVNAMFSVLCHPIDKERECRELQKRDRETEPYKTQLAALDAAIALLEQEVRYDEHNQ